jgi:type III restriction enzyme
MNTVGKPGRLGDSIRCVVSVSMLTEGWDANNVTHILGVRAFGTQLLCEQVIGRALRRQSYELNAKGLFNVEYADILGIPFDFTAHPVVAKPEPPPQMTQVKAMRPERDHLEIRFPRVAGYRVELGQDELTAHFTEDSTLVVTPEMTGPSDTQNAGIIGESVNLTLEHLGDMRASALLFFLTNRLMQSNWTDSSGEPFNPALFNQLKRITKQWLDSYLICKGGTYPAQLRNDWLADKACQHITAAITRAQLATSPVKAVIDSYNPTGSTIHVKFSTSKTDLYQTNPSRCHINWAVLDSGWEGEFCRVAENHPRVLFYVKNQNLGFEVPYRSGSESRRYLPDFIVLVDDGHGPENPLHLVVEVKGYRGEDAKQKKETMDTRWIPGVNNDGRFGRWAFSEFTDIYEMQIHFKEKVEAEFNKMIDAIPLTAHASA